MKTIVIPTESLVAARDLALRFRDGPVLRPYVRARLPLATAAALVFAVLVTAGVAATTVLLTRLYPPLVLPAFLLAPFLLAGGCCVAAYLFVSWLEFRALRRALHHDPGPRALPRIPWALVAAFLGIPLLALLIVWWKIGLPLVALGVATPFLYSHFDRAR